jgi:hypothetical protein
MPGAGADSPQAPGERLDDLRRGCGRAALLEPGQVVDRDAGQSGQLLTAQAGRTTTTGDRQTDHLRRDPLAPAAHRSAELTIWHRSSLSPAAPVVLALTVLRPTDHCLSLSARSSIDP